MWKEKHKIETEEKEFFHKQALDSKRKNKLLKVAIGRLQVEREDIKKNSQFMLEGEVEKDTDTFLTHAHVDDKNYGDLDNIENSQAIVEMHLQNSQRMAKPKRGVH